MFVDSSTSSQFCRVVQFKRGSRLVCAGLRRRLEEATRELHQHEEIDVPAFEAWKHRTFPLHLTALRELEREVFTKAQRVHEVEARAAHTGRSIKRVWQEARDARAASAGDRAGPADHEEDDTSRRRQ